MNTTSLRLARARDFALIATGAAFFVLAAIFVAGGIWFRALFVSALGGEPLLYAGAFLAVAVVLGTIHAFAPPPAP